MAGSSDASVSPGDRSVDDPPIKEDSGFEQSEDDQSEEDGPQTNGSRWLDVDHRDNKISGQTFPSMQHDEEPAIPIKNKERDSNILQLYPPFVQNTRESIAYSRSPKVAGSGSDKANRALPSVQQEDHQPTKRLSRTREENPAIPSAEIFRDSNPGWSPMTSRRVDGHERSFPSIFGPRLPSRSSENDRSGRNTQIPGSFGHGAESNGGGGGDMGGTIFRGERLKRRFLRSSKSSGSDEGPSRSKLKMSNPTASASVRRRPDPRSMSDPFQEQIMRARREFESSGRRERPRPYSTASDSPNFRNREEMLQQVERGQYRSFGNRYEDLGSSHSLAWREFGSSGPRDRPRPYSTTSDSPNFRNREEMLQQVERGHYRSFGNRYEDLGSLHSLAWREFGSSGPRDRPRPYSTTSDSPNFRRIREEIINTPQQANQSRSTSFGHRHGDLGSSRLPARRESAFSGPRNRSRHYDYASDLSNFRSSEAIEGVRQQSDQRQSRIPRHRHGGLGSSRLSVPRESGSSGLRNRSRPYRSVSDLPDSGSREEIGGTLQQVNQRQYRLPRHRQRDLGPLYPPSGLSSRQRRLNSNQRAPATNSRTSRISRPPNYPLSGASQRRANRRMISQQSSFAYSGRRGGRPAFGNLMGPPSFDYNGIASSYSDRMPADEQGDTTEEEIPTLIPESQRRVRMWRNWPASYFSENRGPQLAPSWGLGDEDDEDTESDVSKEEESVVPPKKRRRLNRGRSADSTERSSSEKLNASAEGRDSTKIRRSPQRLKQER